MMISRARPHHYLASLSILILTLYLLHAREVDLQTSHAYSSRSGLPGGRQSNNNNNNARGKLASALSLSRWRGSESDDIYRIDLSGIRLKIDSVLGADNVDEGEAEQQREDERMWVRLRKEVAAAAKSRMRKGLWKERKGKGEVERKKVKLGKEGERVRMTREEADRAFCGMSPCKLVVPSFVASHDETSAQQNIQELSVFSSLLDRRLVLPNVHKSHIGICNENDTGTPWETYYDVDAVGPVAGKKGGLTQIKFEQWLLTRPEPPRIQRITISSRQDSPSFGFVGVSSDEHHHRKHQVEDCIADKAWGNVRLDGWEDALVLSENPRSVSDSGMWNEETDAPLKEQIVQMLGNSSAFEVFDSDYPAPKGTTPDILLVTWASPEPLFASTPVVSSAVATSFPSTSSDAILPPGRVALPPAAQLTMPLAYAPGLVNLARRISDPIQPFLSVHWKTEGVPAKMLPTCSRALLDKIESVMASSDGSGIRTVYLATDLPLHPNDLFKSSAYNPTAEARPDDESTTDAVKLIKSAFGRWGMLGRRGVRLTGLREEMWVRGVGEKEKSLAGMDSGVSAILDKLISSHAEMFLAADEPCGLSSTFTNQIIALRNRTLSLSALSSSPSDDTTPSSRLRNLVDHFGSEDSLSLDPQAGSEMTEVQWILD